MPKQHQHCASSILYGDYHYVVVLSYRARTLAQFFAHYRTESTEERYSVSTFPTRQPSEGIPAIFRGCILLLAEQEL